MGPRQFVLMLSVLIGLFVGLAAVVIKNLVHLIDLFLTEGLVQQFHHYLYFIFPTLGILMVVVFIRYVNKRPVQHGIPGVLHAISKKNGLINRHNLYSSVITSAKVIYPGFQIHAAWRPVFPHPRTVTHRHPTGLLRGPVWTR